MNSLAQDLGAHLFAWSATALVHGLILFTLVWAAERLGLLRRPGLRQTAWRTVLLVPLLSAALQVFVLGGSPITRHLLTPETSVVETTRAAIATASVVVPVVDTQRLLDQGAGLLGWAWLALVAVGAARIIAQRHSLRRYRRRLTPVSGPATIAMADTLSRHAGLTGVQLLDDPNLDSPIALAPRVVVLPSWTRDAFSDLQRKALLAHEIRHLARRDPQWRALNSLLALATLAPWGGAVLRRLEDMAEYACDAWSAGQTGAGQPLAECLAVCMERGLGRRLPASAAAMARANSPVVDRVSRLVQGRAEGADSNVWVERAVLTAVIGAAALMLPGLAVGEDQAGPQVIRRIEMTGPAPSSVEVAAAWADADAANADAAAARADAEALKTEAEAARNDADVRAEAARNDAEVRAEAAKADADAAQAVADTARADADTAQADADTAQADADTARADAETARADAEAARAQNRSAAADNRDAEAARAARAVASAAAKAKP